MGGGEAGTTTRDGAPGLVGREQELCSARSALERGRAVVVWGPPGIGRSAFARQVEPRRARVGHAMATLAFRPFLVLESALRCDAPVESPDGVVDWAVESLGGAVLVAEDLHLAHPSSLTLLRQLAGRVPLVMTVARARPGSPAVERALASWGPLRPEEVRLGVLDDGDAARLVRSVAPDLDDDAVDSVVRYSAGIPAWLVAGARGGAQRRVDGALDGLDVAARTALVAAALLGRPAADELLGPGSAMLVDAGVASRRSDGQLVVVSAIAAAALERVSADDRARVHDWLADRIDDDGERARHLAAAGRHDEAVDAALAAAGAATTRTERAAHLHFATLLRPSEESVRQVVAALLAVGDLATATTWCERLSLSEPADAVLAARIHRYAGRVDLAASDVRAGLDASVVDTPEWRDLLVEALWLGVSVPLGLPAGDVLAACADTSQEPTARVAAAVVQALDTGSTDALAELDLSVLVPPESFHVGLLVVRALLRFGDAEAAAAAAERAASMAESVDAGSWATMARIESLWCRYLLTGEPAAVAGVSEMLAGALSAAARDRAAALLQLAVVDGDPLGSVGRDAVHVDGLWAAVAAEASLAVGDVDEASVAAALAGLPDADPVVALLAGPARVGAAVRIGRPWSAEVQGYPILSSEAEAMESGSRPELLDAAGRWRRVAVRGVVRCLLASGSGEDRAAAERLAVDAGLARWAAQAGWHPPKGDGVLTARERQVMDLVAAGCTTPVIARRLGIADSTAESHVKSARIKLGATTRAGAVARLT